MSQVLENKAAVAVDWLLRSYLPTCLELAGINNGARSFRLLPVDTDLGVRAKWMSGTFPGLEKRMQEERTSTARIDVSASSSLYTKVIETIGETFDNTPWHCERTQVLAAAANTWMIAVDAIEMAAGLAKNAGEAEWAVFVARVDALHQRLAKELDERLSE